MRISDWSSDVCSSDLIFDWLQLVLVGAALAVDAVALTAMLTRIAEFGFTANKVAALGLNLVLLVHLAWAAWLAAGFVRGQRTRSEERRVGNEGVSTVRSRWTACN